MRHYIPRAILAIVFAMMLIGADAPIPIVPHAGTQADPFLVYASETIALAFDDVYTTADVTIARIDVEVLSDVDVLVTTWSFYSGWAAANGTIKMPIRPEATVLPNGTYKLRARIWDVYGVVSEYSELVWAKKKWVALNRPGGCKVLP